MFISSLIYNNYLKRLSNIYSFTTRRKFNEEKIVS